MTDQENTPDDGEQSGEQSPEYVPNRRERRGSAQQQQGVNKITGRPQQANFVGRRLFRRNGG